MLKIIVNVIFKLGYRLQGCLKKNTWDHSNILILSIIILDP